MQSKRQWMEQKRSWIFFKDRIKEDKNIICDSVEGNIFMLDCESARLSIWSEKWKTFIDVGVNSLLKEESIARKTGKAMSSAEIRIFYKGMELEKRSVQRDAGIIEFIDIKKDLERAYINISRGSFTRKGSTFFEEKMYPGLLEAVQKVLKYLAKTAIHDNISEEEEEEAKNSLKEETENPSKEKAENFSDKIIRILKEKCDKLLEQRNNVGKEANIETAKLRNEIVSLTVSVSVLAFYSVRDEWNITETLDKPKPYGENAWLALVRKMDKKLTECDDEFILCELAKVTKFFDIKVYNEDHRKTANDAKESELRFKFRFTQIFLERNHWAVLQIRKDHFSRWNSYLILLNEESPEFQMVISFPRTQEACQKLERWGEYLCNVVDLGDDEADSSQQFLMNWILKNIPTAAMFCNKEGNVRVNILTRRIYPSVFLNENFKYLILDRMMEKAETDGIQRFSTITWQGNENFGCKELPYNIYFTKRGYFAHGACRRSIMPFEGELLVKLKGIIENPSDIEKRIISMIEFADIQHIIQTEYKDEQGYKLSGKLVMGVGAAIAEVILTHIREKKIKSRRKDLDELLREIDNIDEPKRQDLRNAMVEYGINYSGFASSENTAVLEMKIRGNDGFDLLCNAWIYLMFETEQILDIMDYVMIEYSQYIDNKRNPLYQKKKERLADYLADKIPYKFNREHIIRYIDTYEKELLALFHSMECQRVQQKIDTLLENNRYLVSRLFCLTNEKY